MRQILLRIAEQQGHPLRINPLLVVVRSVMEPGAATDPHEMGRQAEVGQEVTGPDDPLAQAAEQLRQEEAHDESNCTKQEC